jgi:hypothetical protein
MLRPATHSTNDPPIEITDLRLHEYVAELRRRIEIQNIQMEILAKQIQKLQTDTEQLSLDLHLRNR